MRRARENVPAGDRMAGRFAGPLAVPPCRVRGDGGGRRMLDAWLLPSAPVPGAERIEEPCVAGGLRGWHARRAHIRAVRSNDYSRRRRGQSTDFMVTRVSGEEPLPVDIFHCCRYSRSVAQARRARAPSQLQRLGCSDGHGKGRRRGAPYQELSVTTQNLVCEGYVLFRHRLTGVRRKMI
jgi:hypothetical protein